LVSTSIGTKKGRIYGKELPFKGAPQRFRVRNCPKLPPPRIRHWYLAHWQALTI